MKEITYEEISKVLQFLIGQVEMGEYVDNRNHKLVRNVSFIKVKALSERLREMVERREEE